MDKQDIQHWNGEGLPPVGIEVEFKNNGYCCSGHIPDDLQAVSVVAHKTTTDGNPVAVVYWDDSGAGGQMHSSPSYSAPSEPLSKSRRKGASGFLTHSLRHLMTLDFQVTGRVAIPCTPPSTTPSSPVKLKG